MIPVIKIRRCLIFIKDHTSYTTLMERRPSYWNRALVYRCMVWFQMSYYDKRGSRKCYVLISGDMRIKHSHNMTLWDAIQHARFCYGMMTSSNGTFSGLLAFCAGNSPVTGEFPSQRPVTRSFDVFFDLCLNKRLSKQSRDWWFEMPSGSLWRNCNGSSEASVFHVNVLYHLPKGIGLVCSICDIWCHCRGGTNLQINYRLHNTWKWQILFVFSFASAEIWGNTVKYDFQTHFTNLEHCLWRWSKLNAMKPTDTEEYAYAKACLQLGTLFIVSRLLDTRNFHPLLMDKMVVIEA